MTKNPTTTLIKDVIFALIAWGLSAMVLRSFLPDMAGYELALMSSYCAGIPFGWRWASKIITAVSLYGVGIKLLISLVLGMFAIVIVLGGDVIRFIVHATKNGVKRNRPEPQVEVC